MSVPTSAGARAVDSDLFPLLVRGEWSAIAGIEGLDVTTAAQRKQLALVKVGYRLHGGTLEQSTDAAAEAVASGVNRRALTTLLLASAAEDLACASQAADLPERAQGHRETARHLLGQMGHLAAAAAGATTDYRAEVLRQRQIIADLRASLHAKGAAASPAGTDASLIQQIIDAHLTYLSPAKMSSLARTVRAIEEQRIPGAFIEAGCALGGSTVLIARTKRIDRAFAVHDVFGMIPPPGPNDTPDVHERYQRIVAGESDGIGGDRYYGYEVDLYNVVQRNLQRFGVDLKSHHTELVRGLVQDTLVGDGPVAFAHLDVDWYEPVQCCLERLHPRLSVGGSIVVDDYHDWGGCRRAVDEFLSVHGGDYVVDDSARSLKLTRIGSRNHHD